MDLDASFDTLPTLNAPFVGLITAATWDGTTWGHAWVEMVLDPQTVAGYVVADGGRRGLPGDGLAYELTGRRIDPGTLVQLRLRGAQAGALVYEAQHCCSPSGADAEAHSQPMTLFLVGNVCPTILDVFTWDGLSGAGPPTTADIPPGRFTVWKDTTSGEARLWYNDGGTMKSGPALT